MIGTMFAPLPTVTEGPQETSEAAQAAVAVLSLASVVALLIGAIAATLGVRLAARVGSEARPSRK